MAECEIRCPGPQEPQLTVCCPSVGGWNPGPYILDKYKKGIWVFDVYSSPLNPTRRTWILQASVGKRILKTFEIMYMEQLKENLAFKFESRLNLLLCFRVNCFVIFIPRQDTSILPVTIPSTWKESKWKLGAPWWICKPTIIILFLVRRMTCPYSFNPPPVLFYWGFCHSSLYSTLEDYGPGSTCSSFNISFLSVLYRFH